MKELIVQALNDAIVRLEDNIPQTKKNTIYVGIEDVKPTDILSFMKDNNIPDTAEFGGKPNGYDAFDEMCLVYDVDIPTTDKDKLKLKRSRFTNFAFRAVYDLLIVNGYKRVGYRSSLLKPFDDTTVYDMYINKEFDRLVEYYSLPFVKEV
jgi:hypothetical protein